MRRLQPTELGLLTQIDMGYTVDTGYQVAVMGDPTRYVFTLTRQQFTESFSREYDWNWELDESVREHAQAGLVFIAESGGQVLGMVEGDMQENGAMQVFSLYVGRQYRGQGIGTALLQALEQVAIDLDARALALETQVSNGPAIDFYIAQGFQVVGLHFKYYSNSDLEHGETAVFLHRDLD